MIGDFSNWQPELSGALAPQGDSGIWAGVISEAKVGDRYKFRIRTRAGHEVERADPMAFASELPPATASVVTDLSYEWNDANWLADRPARQHHDKPLSIYEMHVGSWRHSAPFQSLSWSELADPLADYLIELGFTHVELMPITEHPFYGSWGYQTTSYFAPTARFGLPTEAMGFIDRLHQRGVGVILDWVPSHFPSDDFALGRFDGSPLYEHADRQEGWHPDWQSYIFNYGRHEVRAFLVSSAMSWIERYHIDGIRVDAVASMLYRDYSRSEGEWVKNVRGGRENLEAIAFLQQLNETIGASHPDVLTIAEESTAFDGVTRPVANGGLGFHYKWDMGWMHDTLEYFERDPIHRRFHHGDLTRRTMWAFSENYVLPLSHDEVTHGKGSLLAKLPGDDWTKFAGLRVLLANQWLSPGKKLLFQGQEFGQRAEWNHDQPIDWDEAAQAANSSLSRWVSELNALYQAEPALHSAENEPEAFQWVVLDDNDNSVVAWLRYGTARSRGQLSRPVLCVLNLTPVARDSYCLGAPIAGNWQVLLSSESYSSSKPSSGKPSAESQSAVLSASADQAIHGFGQGLKLNLAPLEVVVLAPIS